MKKFLILIALLLLGTVATGHAQAYPPELYGIPYYSDLAYPIHWDLVSIDGPISVPVDTDLVYIGWVGRDEQGGYLGVTFQIECLYRPYVGCIAPPPAPEFATGVFMTINPELQSYGSFTQHGSRLEGTVFVYRGGFFWNAYTGCLDYTGSPPQFWDWSPDCYHFVYEGVPGLMEPKADHNQKEHYDAVD